MMAAKKNKKTKKNNGRKNNPSEKGAIETFFSQRGFHKFGETGEERSFCLKEKGGFLANGVNKSNSDWPKATHIIMKKETIGCEMNRHLNSLVKILKKIEANGDERFVYHPLDDSKKVEDTKYEVYHVIKRGDNWERDQEYHKEGLLKNLVENGAFSHGSIKDCYASCKPTEQRYIKSLLAKPFVILTGNSGTGKTNIACQLAKSFKVLCVSTQNSNDLFSVGEVIGDNAYFINEITEDLIYVVKPDDDKRRTPIPKGLLNEFIAYYKEDPARIGKKQEDVKNAVLQSENAKFDKFMYRLDSILCALAKHVIKKTGKVYLANKNSLLVPVGADWTDNTKILGYYNPIADEGKGRYIKSDILEFIELANENPTKPFFLILDEMNLSHVERYFSDFLSKMETPDDEFDIEHYGKVKYPKNLFVTGTVNIDETTYMFSPKVLDRANVIEFCPEMKDVLGSLASKENWRDGHLNGSGNADAFMELVQKIQGENIPSELTKKMNPYISEDGLLAKIYVALKECGFEFAYRTMKEIRRYVFAAYELCENKESFDIESILDEQIVQKILPKIHGNKKQIGLLLQNLKESLASYDLCNNKIEQMIEKMGAFQYSSFI